MADRKDTMSNPRVKAAWEALKPAILAKDDEAAGKVLTDLAKTDWAEAQQICDELFALGLRRVTSPVAGA